MQYHPRFFGDKELSCLVAKVKYECSKFSVKNYPQGDNTEVTDFEQKVVHDQTSTTTFIETAPQVMGTMTKPTLSVSTYVEHEADIKAFLGRPQLISSGQWTTGQGNNTNLASGSVASALTGNAIWSNKIAGFNLIKGDFIVRVELNCSPFQQGKLLLHYLPCYNEFVAINPKFTGRANKQLIQKVQHPHVELDCRRTSVALRIPYVAPSHFYGLKEGHYDWGSWFLDVFSALSTGSAAPSGQLLVDYLIYGYFENIELVAPVVPQGGKGEVTDRSRVKETSENQGPIESGLRKVGKVATIVKDVPLLSDIAKPVGWASDILANIASVWGWSKPRELNGVTVVSDQLVRYAGTCDGPSLAIPGGITSLNRIETIDYGSFTNVDEMSLAYLFKIPTYFSEITWTAGVGQNYNLFSQVINPLQMYQNFSDTVAGHTAIYNCYAPLGYLAQFFQYWRGSLKMTLKFIKTQMHSGRLQVTWTPCTNVTTTPTASNSTYALRTIIDMRTEDEITLELPYLAYTDYLNNHSSAGPSTSGQVDIVVLNDVRAPESCSQAIAIQVFFCGGDDFELAVPTNTVLSNFTYMPQGSNEEVLHGAEQGMSYGDTIVGAYSSADKPVFHATRCIGEKVMSIKSLLLRNSVINGFGSSLGSFTSALLYPHFLASSQLNGSGVVKNSAIGGDLFSWLVPMYAFMRGSVNITYNDFQNSPSGGTLNFGNFPTASATSITQPMSVSAGAIVPNLAFGGSNNLITTQMWPAEPCNFMSLGTQKLYQHIPYYNRFPLSLTLQFNAIDTPLADASMPISSFGMASSVNVTNYQYQRAVGDDFQAMFFIGCPPVLVSYT